METTYLSQTIEKQLREIKERELTSLRLASKNHLYWKIFLGITLFIGAITPLIVIFRKQPFLPQQFWVWWCIVTPMASSLFTYLMSYFDWEGKSASLSKEAQLLHNLEERAKVKYASASKENLNTVFEWILEEKSRIEAIIS